MDGVIEMKILTEVQESKRAFVENHLSETLRAAKPNLVRCEYMLGAEANYRAVELDNSLCIDDFEYVVVTCENRYRYFVNVSANSLIAIATAVLEAMMYK
jgi:hypothetical protein